MTENIKLILLFSGKRKCGKDFLTAKLMERYQNRAQIIRISEPIKTAWAEKLNLDIKELLSDGPYKEQYRKEMIIWSDEIRKKDPGFFCREAMKKAAAEMIVVSDIRRKTDIKWFQETFGKEKLKCIRIYADDAVREARGWKFEPGVDDVESECDLDDFFLWDMMCDNGDVTQTNTVVTQLCDFIDKELS
ncbi:phosphomevalonate kinase [Culicoides brevitarsis]|uniref:phosphomevalonate kinase n=1 Tax=Culicoides brevitarsis TaxID=469753 RepID=UPI00307C8945